MGLRIGLMCGLLCGAANAPARSSDDRPRTGDPRAARRRVRSALEHVVGPQRQIEAVTIGPDDDVEQRRKNISTPSNASTPAKASPSSPTCSAAPRPTSPSPSWQPKVEVLAGINLPMLIKLAKVRETCPLEEAVSAAQEAGRKYMHHRQPRPEREMSTRRRGRPSASPPCPMRSGSRSSTRRACTPALRPNSCRPPRVRRRGHASPARRDRRRHLDHGPDDAGGRPRHDGHGRGTGNEAAGRGRTRSLPR